MFEWQHGKVTDAGESLMYSLISPSICAYVCNPDALQYLRGARQNVAAKLPIAPLAHWRYRLCDATAAA